MSKDRKLYSNNQSLISFSISIFEIIEKVFTKYGIKLNLNEIIERNFANAVKVSTVRLRLNPMILFG